MKLRPYQVDAIESIKKNWQKGINTQLLVLPTGTGKTCVFSSLGGALGITKRVLILVHREELADQAADKYKRWNPLASVAVEMATRRATPSDNVVVASVQTLRKGSPRLLALDPGSFGLIITDEAHHATADSYISIYEHFDVLPGGKNEHQILHCGVTATPNRADGEGLTKIYSTISYSMDILTAIKDGWLANIRGLKVSSGQSLDGVHTRMGDFAVDELSDAVNNDPRNNLIVKHWLRDAKGLPTLVFCVDIAHARAVADTFRSHAVQAEAVWGDDPQRQEKLKNLREGKIKVLCNCSVLTEGYDDWTIRCIVMARPTKSQLLFVQCCGRGTRIPEGISNLNDARAAKIPIAKEDCIIIDVVDSSDRHSLVTLPTLFGLGARLDLQGKTITQALQRFDEVQEEHPQADLKDAADLDKLESYATSIDLFSMRWADEVLEGSTLQWHRAPDGHYVLYTRERRIDVFEDLLQTWNVKVKLGDRSATKIGLKNLPEAFSYAETYLRERCPEEITLVKRDARWHKDLASDGQIKLLKKFRIPIKAGLTKGEAQLAISRLIKRK